MTGPAPVRRIAAEAVPAESGDFLSTIKVTRRAFAAVRASRVAADALIDAPCLSPGRAGGVPKGAFGGLWARL